MEFLIPLVLLAIGGRVVRTQEQRQRIALLGSYLGRFRVEKLMETLMQGYARALDESEPERREQIWRNLAPVETELSSQFAQFAEAFTQVWSEKALVSTLPIALPFATRLFPGSTFDLRHAMAIHAQGIAAVVDNVQGLSPRDRAYTLMAELLLMQHSCHWFCRSRAVASARMVVRHQTRYDQLIGAVSAETRRSYCRLVRCR